MSTVDGTSRPSPPWTVSSRRSLVPSSDGYRDGSFIPTSSRALCGAALALVTVSLTSALWRRPTKAVTSLRPSKFTSAERRRNARVGTRRAPRHRSGQGGAAGALAAWAPARRITSRDNALLSPPPRRAYDFARFVQSGPGQGLLVVPVSD